MDGTPVTSDQQGQFGLSGVPEKVTLTATAEGFQRAQVDIERQTSVEITLEKPFAAKGLYLTYYGIGDEGLRGHVLDLADTTEVNAVVIDIKGDRGWIAYKSSVPMVAEIGAQQDITIPDPKALLAGLKKRGIYTIARIVTFKDNPLATSRPDLAVINAYTGQPWVDMEGLAGSTPCRRRRGTTTSPSPWRRSSWDSTRCSSTTSASRPTRALATRSTTMQFPKRNNMENRMAAINGFLEKARQGDPRRGRKDLR